MERLVVRLQNDGYVAAGLHGLTSVGDLLLGPSSDVLNNPHLRISPAASSVLLKYEDGSQPDWSATVTFEDLFERVERIIVKRARWFRKNPSEGGS